LDSRKSLAQLYRLLRKCWRTPNSILGDFYTSLTSSESLNDDYPIAEPYLCLMAIDAMSYLPDDILVKVDRAAMSVSLETRAPLLDHRVVTWLWQIPVEMRIRDNQGKWILRRLLERYLPRELFERTKQGFAVPIDAWLTGALRSWVESLIDVRRLKQEGYLNPTAVHAIWQAHLRGEHRAGHIIWPIVIFQAWLEDAQVAASRSPQVTSPEGRSDAYIK